MTIPIENSTILTNTCFWESSKCGDYCVSIKRFTHFSSGKYGYCWVKDMHGPSVVQTVYKTTPLCGFIPVSYLITFTRVLITPNLKNVQQYRPCRVSFIIHRKEHLLMPNEKEQHFLSVRAG